MKLYYSKILVPSLLIGLFLFAKPLKARVSEGAATITSYLSQYNFVIEKIVKKKIPASTNKSYYIVNVKTKSGRAYKIRAFPDSDPNEPYKYFIHKKGKVKPLPSPKRTSRKKTTVKNTYETEINRGLQPTISTTDSSEREAYEESKEELSDKNVSVGALSVGGGSFSGASASSKSLNLSDSQAVSSAKSDYQNGCGTAVSMSVMSVGTGLADTAAVLSSGESRAMNGPSIMSFGGERVVDRSQEFKESGHDPLKGALEKPYREDSISNQLTDQVNSREMQNYSNQAIKRALRNLE